MRAWRTRPGPQGQVYFRPDDRAPLQGCPVEVAELRRRPGEVSGILGTDVSKRDLFTGVVIGIRWALIIGILTSIVTVIVGRGAGRVAAYFGGAAGLAPHPALRVRLPPARPALPDRHLGHLQALDLDADHPHLPLLLDRALQARLQHGPADQGGDLRRGLEGAGLAQPRIIFRHIIPILLPYSFAVMALSVPAVIVYEASVSLLGLGDSSIVTWGQILEAALGPGRGDQQPLVVGHSARAS